MSIHIFCKPNGRDKTISKLEIFSSIIKVDQENMLILKYKTPLYYNDTKKYYKYKKNYETYLQLDHLYFIH